MSQLQTSIINILALDGTIACAPPFSSQARGSSKKHLWISFYNCCWRVKWNNQFETLIFFFLFLFLQCSVSRWWSWRCSSSLWSIGFCTVVLMTHFPLRHMTTTRTLTLPCRLLLLSTMSKKDIEKVEANTLNWCVRSSKLRDHQIVKLELDKLFSIEITFDLVLLLQCKGIKHHYLANFQPYFSPTSAGLESHIVFTIQIWEWYQSSHISLCKRANVLSYNDKLFLWVYLLKKIKNH